MFFLILIKAYKLIKLIIKIFKHATYLPKLYFISQSAVGVLCFTVNNCIFTQNSMLSSINLIIIFSHVIDKCPSIRLIIMYVYFSEQDTLGILSSTGSISLFKLTKC